MRINHFTSLIFLLLTSSGLFAQDLHLSIETVGATSENAKDSLSYQQKHTDAQSVLAEVAKVSEHLSKKGYFELKVAPLIRKNDTLFISKMSLGKRTDMLNIRFSKEIRERLSMVNDSLEIRTEDYEGLVNDLQRQLSSAGYLFDQISLTDIQLKNNIASGTLKIINKGKRTIDLVTVKGYNEFPMTFIKHATKLRKGRSLDLELITQESKNLNNLPFINEIKPPEILFEKDSSTVYLYFEKTKSNYFDGFLGFATDEETNNLTLNGYVDLRLVNNLNNGESLNLSWKNDGNEQTRFIARASVPFIFSSPVGVEASLDIFRKDSTFLNTELAFKLGYQLSPKARVTAGVLQYESNDLLDNSPIDVEDLTATKLSVGYNYRLPNTDDALFIDKAGILIEANFGNRKTSFSKEEQYTIEVDANYLWKLNLRNRIFVRANAAFLNSDNYFENEKYRLGGINSIRGFNENSLEATFFSYLNTEYRFLLSNSTYINSIFDVAFLQDDLIGTKDNLFGFGIGLGIRSKAGLFKLNYALGKTSESSVRFSDAKVQISFTSIF